MDSLAAKVNKESLVISRENAVQMDSMEKTANLEWTVRTVRTAAQELRENPGIKVNLAFQENLACPEIKVDLVFQVKTVKKDSPVSPDLKGTPEDPAGMVYLEHQEQLENLGRLENLVLMDLRENLVLLVSLEKMAKRELLVNPALSLDRRVIRVLLDHKDVQVLKESQELMVCREYQPQC